MSDQKVEYFRQVTKALRFLNHALPMAPGMNEQNLLAYTVILDGIPPDVISKAIYQVLESWEYAKVLPTAGQIKTAAMQILATTAGIPEPEAAWREVRKALATYGVRGVPTGGDAGGYSEFIWSHDVIGQAIDAMGGLAYLSESTNISTDRAHWLKTIYPAVLHHWQLQAVHSRRLLTTGGQVNLQIGEGRHDTETTE